MSKYFFIIGFCLLPWLVHGGVYQWVDKSGRVHFGNIPPQQQEEYKTGNIKYQAAPKRSKDEMPKKESPKKELPKKKLPATTSATASTPPQADKKSDVLQPMKSPDRKSPLPNASTENIVSKEQPASKSQFAKFQDRKILKEFIEHLREKVKPSHSLHTSGTAEPKPVLPKTTMPASNHKSVTSVEPVVIKTDKPNESGQKEKNLSHKESSKGSDKQTGNVEKTVSEKIMVEKAGVEKAVVEKAVVEKEMAKKDAEKCGVFSAFVLSYETKIAEGCPGAHCSVYKRSLKKYKLKQKRYCGSN